MLLPRAPSQHAKPASFEPSEPVHRSLIHHLHATSSLTAADRLFVTGMCREITQFQSHSRPLKSWELRPCLVPLVNLLGF